LSSAKSDFEHIPALIYYLAKSLDRTGRLAKLYSTWHSLVNYAIVCGIGVFINNAVQKILYSWATYLNWFIVNNIAIVVAFLWNWFFTAGPYGYIWGLSPPGWWKRGAKHKQSPREKEEVVSGQVS